MPLDLTPPITYLITSGETTLRTTPRSNEFANILKLIEAAVAAELSLVQIREKQLTACVLFELVGRCAEITRASQTRLLVNDRVDVALTASADGVQLTSESLSAGVVKQLCPADFLIGVSTHSLGEARVARDYGADFVLFGPAFETESKKAFGPPQGMGKLREVAVELDGVPVVAIGGVTAENSAECFRAGASGVAAIRLFSDPRTLTESVKAIRDSYRSER